MSMTQTVRRPPPLRQAQLSKVMEFWELETQQQSVLIEGDTSTGDEVETLPPAGLNESTGQTNQNSEYTYILASGSGTLTIDGAVGGSVVLSVLNSVARFKSNGTVWRRII